MKLIKFFPNGQGRGSGPVGYLIADQVLAYDANRDLIREADGQPMHTIRDPRPEVLRGNAERRSFLAGVMVAAFAVLPTAL